MNMHIVLNACLADALPRARQLNHFIERYCKPFKQGITFLIAKNGQDKEQLLKLALSKHVEIIWIKEYLPEAVLDVLCSRMNQQDIYLFGNDQSGIELSVRSAARKNGTSLLNGNCLWETSEGLVVGKSVYSNHCQGSFLVQKMPFCLSIARGLGERELVQEANILEFEWNNITSPSFLVSQEVDAVEKAESLEDAKFLIALGRGARSKENVLALENLAKQMGAKLGVSRPAAMNAWTQMEKMIGVSGAILSPEICIAAGASGAAAFYAGIEKSKLIIAINTDERAPIMKKADIAIVSEYQPVLEALALIMKRP